jgi:hypothetical protein
VLLKPDFTPTLMPILFWDYSFSEFAPKGNVLDFSKSSSQSLGFKELPK